MERLCLPFSFLWTANSALWYFPPMQGPFKARWVELCEQAAVEQDPGKLLELIREINRLLREKQDRLENKSKSSAAGN